MKLLPETVFAVSMKRGKPEICAMIADFITTKGESYYLDSPQRVKHFLGQVAVESMMFTRLEESLYYSEDRLTKVWPNRFPTIKAAAPYARNPQALANKTYGGRMGNTGPNDGWLFRGSSLKMITGKNNFAEFNEWIHHLFPTAPDFVKNPDALRSLDWAVWPGVWYWVSRKCYTYADNDDAKGLTRAINGGLIGYEDRVNATAYAGKVLNIQTNPQVSTVAPKTPDPLLKEYQDKMNRLGVALRDSNLKVEADGWNGPKTMAAVRYIQQKTKLNVDGKLGPNTRKAIDLLMEKNGVN